MEVEPGRNLVVCNRHFGFKFTTFFVTSKKKKQNKQTPRTNKYNNKRIPFINGYTIPNQLFAVGTKEVSRSAVNVKKLPYIMPRH